ncbi:hypothetical protein GA0115252_18212 [Streptomyces sp. DfronAA-171]|nr:hypothetical protein GA0115252_18212 [Streptomyces sp. DfronAA-171]
MLASTVQFSNNDQPPITPRQKPQVHWGRKKDSHTAVPSDTQQRARHPQPPKSHVPRRSSTSDPGIPRVPNSQRSTHEQPASNIRRCTGPLTITPKSSGKKCSLERR